MPRRTTELERIQELEVELSTSRQRVQAIIEEDETSQEEMRASNEEMQSANEELRSMMEELETSKKSCRASTKSFRQSIRKTGTKWRNSLNSRAIFRTFFRQPRSPPCFWIGNCAYSASRRNSVNYSTFVLQIAAGPSLT